ncbi:hypothetical protein BHE74_00006136 [Ensete ventricosum]|nr:hypothetical protein BHE74_00006136 [Ensete ventricosum]
MDWTSKIPFSFDWETLALLNGEETEISKSAQELKSKIGNGIGMGNGSLYLSGGDMFSSSEAGYHSFKSSIAASDSTSNAKKKIPELNFESVGGFLVNQNKNKDLARVDISETSPAVASAEGTKEPVISLKLGKRTYFEDPCMRNNIKSSYFPASNPLLTTSVKKSRGYQQNLLKAYCQLFKCIRLPSWSSFRFHALSEFDQKKRSCRRRLSDHNARRRKPQLETISFSSSKLSVSYYVLYYKVCNFDLYRPVWAVCTSPLGYRYADRPLGYRYADRSLGYRYADRPLPGGTAKIDRRRPIEGEIDRRRSISGEKGKKRKRRKKNKRSRRKKYLFSLHHDKQQANLVFGQSPFRQMTSIPSSIWDGSGSFKLTQSEGSWRKSSKTGSTNGQLLFPSNAHLSNVYTGHDMDSLLARKGTTAEILNQGLEATATFHSDGAPDLWRALSLLSTNKSRSPPITGHANDACPEQPLSQVLPFELRSDGGHQLRESPLFKPFFGTGFVDTSHLS